MQKIEINWQELPYALREEMKVLRTNLKFSGADKRVIMMTSAASHRGSFCARRDTGAFAQSASSSADRKGDRQLLTAGLNSRMTPIENNNMVLDNSDMLFITFPLLSVIVPKWEKQVEIPLRLC
jgi:hypothetical protein